MGASAAFHGVHPEAVEEGCHCSVGFFCVCFLLLVSCGNNLPTSVVIKACVKSSRYPLTCPNRGVRCACLFGFIQCTHSKVNGHEKIFTTDH